MKLLESVECRQEHRNVVGMVFHPISCIITWQPAVMHSDFQKPLLIASSPDCNDYFTIASTRDTANKTHITRCLNRLINSSFNFLWCESEGHEKLN